jgi:hypothetical protein
VFRTNSTITERNLSPTKHGCNSHSKEPGNVHLHFSGNQNSCPDTTFFDPFPNSSKKIGRKKAAPRHYFTICIAPCSPITMFKAISSNFVYGFFT